MDSLSCFSRCDCRFEIVLLAAPVAVFADSGRSVDSFCCLILELVFEISWNNLKLKICSKVKSSSDFASSTGKT